MIEALVKNLNRGLILLESVTAEQYKDTTVAPYYSSIGGHIRHILDIYDCIFEGLSTCKIDLTARKRNLETEELLAEGINYMATIIGKLQNVKSQDLQLSVEVSDDLGAGKVTASYTLSAILIQAHSHAIHHYASIGYIIHQLGLALPDDAFGFNPTTPKNTKVEV
jgi:uncharacterized damage-inducible protein DinB